MIWKIDERSVLPQLHVLSMRPHHHLITSLSPFEKGGSSMCIPPVASHLRNVVHASPNAFQLQDIIQFDNKIFCVPENEPVSQ